MNDKASAANDKPKAVKDKAIASDGKPTAAKRKLGAGKRKPRAAKPKPAAAKQKASAKKNEAAAATKYLWTTNHELKELASKVRVNVIVDRIWKTLFTEEERQQISADDTMGPDIIDIWAKFKRMSGQRAVADLARKMDLLSDAGFHQLLRSIGEESPPLEKPPLPDWNKSLGELRFDGQLIKRVRQLKVATNVIQILDVFQEEGWPSHVEDPLSPIKTLRQNQTQRLQEAVKSLNQGLKVIRFRTDGTGEGVVWERV